MKDRRRLYAGVALGWSTGFAILGGVLLVLSHTDEPIDEAGPGVGVVVDEATDEPQRTPPGATAG